MPNIIYYGLQFLFNLNVDKALLYFKIFQVSFGGAQKSIINSSITFFKNNYSVFNFIKNYVSNEVWIWGRPCH